MTSASRENHQRILVIDDNVSIHEDFRKILSPDTSFHSALSAMEAALFGEEQPETILPTYEVNYAPQGQEGLMLVEQAEGEGNPYALAFVDGRMPPGWDGIETINHLWRASPALQIVLCTAYADYSWEEIQRELGETDSLVILKKPFDNVEVLQLAHTLTSKWAMNRQIEGKLHQLAYYDSLTGLSNRVKFQQRLSEKLTAAQQGTTRGALLFIDLDDFKRVNDTLGHNIGDELLKIVAQRIASSIRQADRITEPGENCGASRLGGDEFAVLLDNLESPETAAAVARRIASKLAQPVDLGQHQVLVTSSIGIALFPDDGDNPETILKNADMAMYFSKRMGANNYQFYHQSMKSDTLKRLKLESLLQQAMQRQEFSLAYQPQFNLKTNELSGLEALLRWENDELGEIPPLEFIPIAEKIGLIIPLGEWVLRTACSQAKQWIEEGIFLPRISVNVSPQQFIQSGFLPMVTDILKETGLGASQLQLEITENQLLKDPPGTAKTLQELQQIGVQIAIDDFGTSYSNLARLKDMPINCLKIDRSFISGKDMDPRGRSILAAIIAMAGGMEMEVVAEGVETRDQLNFLKDRGCDIGQGFFLSFPLKTIEATQCLLRSTMGKALIKISI